MDILQQRLYNQRLIGPKFKTATEVVRYFGAVQSQDYNGAKWGISLRTNGLSNESIEKEFNEGKIIRTHVMRPTWHFVAAEDIRWLLELTAPRVNSVFSSYCKKIGLDEKTLAKSREVIERAAKGKHLIRSEIRGALEKSGIDTNGLRFGFILGNAELALLICSGKMRNGEQTYALFDERVPKTKKKTRDEMLAEIVLRYFVSHGPATPQDFAWWSGLTMADGKRGLELNGKKFSSVEVEGKSYWFSPNKKIGEAKGVFLLPNYDEYTVAYKHKIHFFETQMSSTKNFLNYNIFTNAIVSDGKVVGMWRATRKKVSGGAKNSGKVAKENSSESVGDEDGKFGGGKGVGKSRVVDLEKKLFRGLSKDEERELGNQVARYLAFFA